MQREDCIDTIHSIAPRPQIRWRSWAVQGLSLLKRDALALLTAVMAWDRRYKERRALAELDDRLLNDIGLTRAQAEQEIRKRFWNE